MKKQLVCMILAVTSLVAVGQVNVPFEVKAPAWTKIAICETGNGAIIRQQPSATAAKMMYNENAIEDYETPVQNFAVWSTRKATGGWVNHMFYGDAPVMKVSGEWLKLADIGPHRTPAFVAAKLCKQTDILKLPGSFKSNNYIRLLNGDKEGYGLSLMYNEMDGTAEIWIGRLANGFLVCPYVLRFDDVVESNNGKASIERKSNGLNILHWPVKKGEMFAEDLTADKISEQIILEFFKYAKKDATGVMVYAMFKQNGGYSFTSSRVENLVGY